MCKFTENEIAQIRKGDNTPLGRIYAENYQDMLLGLSGKTKSQYAVADMEDKLQDAFFVLRKKIWEPTFKNENICGFIVNIAYNKLRDNNKRQKRITGFDVDEMERYMSRKKDTEEEGLDDEQLRQIKAILKAWKMQGTACEKLLTLLWKEERKLKNIWKELKYKNYDTAKSAKSRCVKKLKEIVDDLLNK